MILGVHHMLVDSAPTRHMFSLNLFFPSDDTEIPFLGESPERPTAWNRRRVVWVLRRGNLLQIFDSEGG
ncbi:hypothetical protein L596_015227 [Steinernema carpocapsae]|uniref:Uncharacterized protein n=1 Tax=Steinernema carpocapsae TaxID=34508 RepID=A0A4U5NEX9_STECR|nr:hypothetical protein L596_015227 [Steinernema carpocapsae]